MTQELSSNWKKLQAKIKAESPSTTASGSSTSKPATAKRKAAAGVGAPPVPKRQKTGDKPAAARAQATGRPSRIRRQGDNAALAQTTARRTPMGVTQSSAVTRGTAATITPSLALWAEDNDISPEDLAEAYNLGVKDNALLHPGGASAGKPTALSARSASAAVATAKTTLDEDRARQNEGLAPADVIASLGRYVAIDCEMVGVGPEGRESALARVSAVDFHGRQVYDSLVAPRPHQRVTDFRTRVTGLRGMQDLKGARDFETVRAEVAALLKGDGSAGGGARVLVGHDVRHDLAALELLDEHPGARVRDTARFSGYRRYGHGPKPALRVLAREVLGVEIQGGAHSSLEDARVAMLLFRRRKPEFDVEHAVKYGRVTGGGDGKDKEKSQGTAKAKKKKKKK